MGIPKRSVIALATCQVVAILFVFLAGWHFADRRQAAAHAAYPECHPRGDGFSYCEVLGADLFSGSGQIDGRLISITGFLANDKGTLTLYPSESDYQLRINTHALVVRAPHSRQRELMKSHGYTYVKLFGGYSSRSTTSSRQGKVGSIRLKDVDVVRPRSSKPGDEELIIDLDDAEIPQTK